MPQTPKKNKLTVHNYSQYTPTQSELTILSKGLTFCPSINYNKHHQIELLKSFDTFTSSINKLAATKNSYKPSMHHPTFKPLKLLQTPKPFQISPMTIPPSINSYTLDTKDSINNSLTPIFSSKSKNMSPKHLKLLKNFRNNHKLLTVKPADKNLGIVILNTEDYISQCLKHLSTDSYTLVTTFPSELKTALEETLHRFKTDLNSNTMIAKNLYCQLLPKDLSTYRKPRFYGLPKIHKQFEHIPPIRPIVSHSNSLLHLTAKFIDYILQPIAQSYPDYLHNSTMLINTLNKTSVTLLVTMDIINLFPSIPQNDCLSILCEELQSHSKLLLFNPNLIMTLVDLHLSNNFFEFENATFHQNNGIAMGSAISPTIANIFMSVFFRRFLPTQKEQPDLLCRYIDDIFILWPNKENFEQFAHSLNSFHHSIKFTSTTSNTSVDFLDVTIYKTSTTHDILHIKTFQKPNNVFQYLHFSSEHPSIDLQRYSNWGRHTIHTNKLKGNHLPCTNRNIHQPTNRKKLPTKIHQKPTQKN